MRLYLCRHGIAGEATGEKSDAERALTTEGLKKFRKAARGLVRFAGAGEVGHILTSPLLRARQTAEILAEAFADAKENVDVGLCEALGPGGRLEDLVKAVRALRPAPQGVVAVGHEPALSRWIGVLCGGEAARVEMKKGAIAAVEMEASGLKGELAALLPPGALRRM